MALETFPSTPSQPDGTAATTSNSNASLVTVTGGPITWSSAFAKFGLNGHWLRETSTSGSTVIRYNLPGGGNRLMAITLNSFVIDSLPPTVSKTVFSLRSASAPVASVLVTTTGSLVLDPQGAGANIVIAAAGVIAVDVPYDYQFLFSAHATTDASGLFSVIVKPSAGGAAVATVAPTNTTLGINPFAAFDIGGSSVIGDLGYWRVQAEDGRTTVIPPLIVDVPLDTPVLTVTGSTNPTTIGGTNGTLTVSWPAVAGADHYEADIVSGTVTSGFVAEDTNATSPKTFTGLAAGPYTVAVRAIAP